MRNIIPLSLFFISTGLSACGGGSNSTTTAPAAPVVTNTAPTVSTANTDQIADVGFEFSYDASQGNTTFTDAQNDSLTYAVTLSRAAGLTVSGAVISGTPDSTGPITVTITATDPSGLTTSDTFDIDVGVRQTAIQTAFGNAINLEALLTYADQTVPAFAGPKVDNNNPVTDAGATLGRVLFYDKSLSVDNSVSCSSCHTQERGFSDLQTVSTGFGGGTTRRHSMRLINGGFANTGDNGNDVAQFWDERANSHEDQETQPLQDENEHGFSGEGGLPDMADLISKMEAVPYYEELFRFAFLSPDITEEKIGLALAQFTKSIQSFDSRYDEGRANAGNNGPFANFTNAENAGLALFNGAAGCNRCHQAPMFAINGNNRGHNGVVGEASDPLAFDFTNTRAPSLRDLVGPDGTPNGPFMHDGSLPTLRAVIDHYDRIIAPAGEPQNTNFRNTLDNRLRQRGGNLQNLNLTETQKDQLEAFLRTLTGTAVYTDERWSNPF